MKKQETQSNAATEPTIRILKIGTCPSLSGKSNLTYHIGCDPEGSIHVRVYSNSSSGYFSREWVSLDNVKSAIGDSISITSYTLHNVYKTGKSQNNGGFCMATLLAEGLVQASSTVDRHYEATDGKNFFEQVQKLIESGVSLDPDAKPSKPSKKKASAPALPA